jgi:hypothetical protein
MILNQTILLFVLFVVFYFGILYVNRVYQEYDQKYIVLEKSELVGTWKLDLPVSYYFHFAVTPSYLIIFGDGTYEYHTPTDFSRYWFSNSAELLQNNKCEEVLVGNWRFTQGKQYIGTQKNETSIINFGSSSSFQSIGNQTVKRIMSSRVIPEAGNQIFFNKVSSETCCPHCHSKQNIDRKKEIQYKYFSGSFAKR